MKDKQIRRVVTLIGTSLAWREQVMRGVAAYAHEHGPWHVYTAPEGFENSLFFTRGYQWNGVLTRIGSRRLAQAIGRLGVPAVNISQLQIAGVTLPRVVVDEAKLAGIAVQHLLSGGFRRFAYCGLAGAPDERGRAFHQAVRDLGYPCVAYRHFTRLAARASWQQRQKDLARWVKSLAKPAGIMTWNADVGCRLLEACNQAAVAVPREVAIIAGDDDRMKCELCDPTVSAVEFPAQQIGYEAATLLDRLMSGAPAPAQPVLIEPSGIIFLRQSSDVGHLAERDVHLAVQFIREHAGERIDIPQVAHHVRVSRRWLERHFHRVLGHSPHDEIRAARLDLARKYLLETDWPAARIAAAAGFGSASYLTSFFRRETGMTPGAFRVRFRL